jgi:hypothetical protein
VRGALLPNATVTSFEARVLDLFGRIPPWLEPTERTNP